MRRFTAMTGGLRLDAYLTLAPKETMATTQIRRPNGRGLIVAAIVLAILGLIGVSMSADGFGRAVGWIIVVAGLLTGIKGFKRKASTRQSDLGLDVTPHASCQRSLTREDSGTGSLSGESRTVDDDPPTEKQIRYAHVLGIGVTPTTTKWELSDLIAQAERDNPKRARQRGHVKRGGKVKEYGEAVVTEEEFWVKFAETTEFMLAVYREGTEIVVDVLRVNGAAIDNRGQVRLEITAPKAVKDRYLGPTLEWERNFKLKRIDLLHYEPLRKDLGFCELDGGNKEYRKIVEHGTTVAKRLVSTPMTK